MSIAIADIVLKVLVNGRLKKDLKIESDLKDKCRTPNRRFGASGSVTPQNVSWELGH